MVFCLCGLLVFFGWEFFGFLFWVFGYCVDAGLFFLGVIIDCNFWFFSFSFSFLLVFGFGTLVPSLNAIFGLLKIKLFKIYFLTCQQIIGCMCKCTLHGM